MASLDPSLRDQLATVIGKADQEGGARAVAEAGARAAIEGLAVPRASPLAHMSEGERLLRNRLRARARQLGDTRHRDGRHDVERLVEQTAYEHWHRMLFARFLAENDLLIHPEHQVSVSLEECEELAASEGASDGWEVAGRYASKMLPQIFRPDDPVLAVRLATEHQRALEGLLAELSPAVFHASDSIGWCYQFWQARRKREVNASGVKIGSEELPPVTQLFTEPYMVDFLLQNTLGAWWVAKGRELPFEMPLLRKGDDGTPVAGAFDGWPNSAAELRVLDPCCGSGHFLVAALPMLVAFRMAEEALDARAACASVLSDNLFGLEIDQRCVQIAAFAVALAAWTYPGAGGFRPLGELNLACCGRGFVSKKSELVALAGDDERIARGIERMWDVFHDAPTLGSLIDPTRDPPDPLISARFDELGPVLTQAMEREVAQEDRYEEVVAASGLAKAAGILTGRYSLVVTNVPYLTERKQGKVLREYCSEYFSDSKTDLATCLATRAFTLLQPAGVAALVTPQNWLLLGSYSGFREHTLTQRRLSMLAPLGTGAFETISGEVVNVALAIVSATPERGASFAAIDAREQPSPAEKAGELAAGGLRFVDVEAQLQNPDMRIVLGELGSGPMLAELVDAPQGIKTGDDGRFRRMFWELSKLEGGWERYQTTVGKTCFFGGCCFAIDWRDEGAEMVRPRRDCAIVGRSGVAVSQMGDLPVAMYQGSRFDSNVAPLVPKDPTLVPALWCFLSSTEYSRRVRLIDRTMKVTNATLTKVTFDEARWRSVARERFPNGLPSASSTDESQWLFVGRVDSADNPLHAATARVLGYRWPDQGPDGLDSLVDQDGIVCIPALRGESRAADRIREALETAYGAEWHPQVLANLLSSGGHNGTLGEWLRDRFFQQHCELFHHRPFIWQIWDGHRDGFSALVNYHKLDHETLKSLTYSYLGDWIRAQEADAKAGKSGAGDKLAKAKVLQTELAKILQGEAPYDIFVRWKRLEAQPIGWHPDLNDGVRLNIRPFMLAKDVGRKGAGVLRYKPRISWGRDKGKNPAGAPWGDVRDNGRHLTLAEKRAARSGE